MNSLRLISLHSLFTHVDTFCVVKEPGCKPLSSLAARIKQQRESSTGSAVWNNYSVSFFSGCAEAEIWALWTCLPVENRFLCRPVKLLLPATWLTIRDGASVLVSVRNQLHYVSLVGRWSVYVYVQVCVCVWVCKGEIGLFKSHCVLKEVSAVTVML